MAKRKEDRKISAGAGTEAGAGIGVGGATRCHPAPILGVSSQNFPTEGAWISSSMGCWDGGRLMWGIEVRQVGTIWLFWTGQTGRSFPSDTLTREPSFPELTYRAVLLTQHWQHVGLNDSSTDFQGLGPQLSPLPSSCRWPCSQQRLQPLLTVLPHRGQQDCDSGREGEGPTVAEGEGPG